MRNIVRLLRINQWVKNVVVFLPVFFSGHLFDLHSFVTTLWAFLALCLLSSATYVINDIFDAQRDRHHPIKKKRPIPSGQVSIFAASVLSLFLLSLASYVAAVIVGSEYLLLIMAGYFALMILYSVKLKHVGIVDSIIISIGFVLRVLAGAIILELNLSAMLVVSIIGAAILISFGKRKAEISSMSYEEAVKHRPALVVYPKGVLDAIISAISAVTFSAYILFSYSYQAAGLSRILWEYLPPRFRDPQWLLLTLPFAFYVLARYLILIYKGESDAPEDIWLGDRELRNGLILWFLLLFVLIYVEQLNTIL